MAKQFTDDDIRDIIAQGGPVVVDFWAPWCGPCLRLGPTIEELAEEYAGRVEIGKYNVDDESDLANDFRVVSIPTLLFFKNGEMQKDLRTAGLLPKAEVVARIEALLAR
ncbi:MAG: thioredoxin [Muribaculaceae bacterium]|nr:thioredoxin [Muribaculaceae bacterium]MBO7382466.1 thioredoxin [Muribaculaceae bacterium]MBP5314491.1 thioredoxin [Muribaculaceae bacterium]MBR4722280.1 thioredoxin [Muribaculaceae bacterium]MBR5437155.1 thioredoxin [Muribaculaceae bacterium]